MPQNLVGVDCLNEIFEHLENDTATLHSCLLVNRLWCQVAVRILWRNSKYYSIRSIRTLLGCLTNESKERLRENGIIVSTPTSSLSVSNYAPFLSVKYVYDKIEQLFYPSRKVIISTSTSKPPMFNYASFCKVLSISDVYFTNISKLILQQSTPSQNLNRMTIIIEQEIYKLFMSQISSLKRLNIYGSKNGLIITTYPGAENSLKNLSELRCGTSMIHSEFFYQLSQICHNIQTLELRIDHIIFDELTDLISVQRSLKCLKLSYYNFRRYRYRYMENIISSLMKKSNHNSLIKFSMDSNQYVS